LGIDAQYNMLTSTAEQKNIASGEIRPASTRYPDGDNSMSNAAFYASHTWKVNERLTVTDGLRGGYVMLHSTFKDTTFYKLPYSEAKQNNFVYSGTVGLIHTPSNQLKLSALFSTGFRVPNVDDLSKVFETTKGNVIVPNTNLKPEKTYTYELGVTRMFGNHSTWENSVYYTDLNDAIITDKFKFNGQDSIDYDGVQSAVFANQNKQRAYIYGFSSQYKTQCTEYLYFTTSLNYTYGRIKTDSSDYPMDHIPPLLLRLELNYAVKKFQSTFFVNYNGWKRLKDYNLNGEDNQQYATPEGMPAWFTLNIHTSYRCHKYVTCEAGIDNLLDMQYRHFASGINAPGRNIYAALRIHFKN
jgi:hemoglobin/transferrin/lactoferrin receptor protein